MEFKQLRSQLKITQAEMAERLGITRSYYGEIEKGREASDTLVNMRDMMEKSLLLERRLVDLSTQSSGRTYSDPSANSDAKIVEEFLARYKGDHVEGRAPDSSVIFDPQWREGETRSPVTVTQILEHLQPWLDAAKKDPNIAPVMLHLLRKHLPHSDLEEPE